MEVKKKVESKKKKLEVKKEAGSEKKKLEKWKKKVGSKKKKLAEVKNIGCRSKTILMENVIPQSHSAFAFSAKSFSIAIILFSLFFSIASLDRMAKVFACVPAIVAKNTCDEHRT